MNPLRGLIFSNPELIRNVRAQLRPKRMAVTAAITGVVALIIVPTMIASFSRGEMRNWGSSFLGTIQALQMLALVFGGGIACLQSIGREKELNTFDYQRITRLTPLELAVGKVLGAPAMAWFVALCLLPAGLLGAAMARIDFSYVLESYVLLLAGSLTFHAFTVMISMVLRRGLSTGSLLVFLLLAGCSGVPSLGLLLLRDPRLRMMPHLGLKFFGVLMPYTPFFSAIYLSLAAWFLLALVRNIKRDPTVYEVYKPGQALGLAAYLNFLFIGLYPWEHTNPTAVQWSSLWLNTLLFFLLGLALLRNRDRARRRLRAIGALGLRWMEAFWPAPYLLAGSLSIGLMVVLLIDWNRDPMAQWSIGLALFRFVFFALWLTRDMLYLQWMNLRPARRPLLRALLYLGVYYVAVATLVGRSFALARPEEAAFTAIFVPVPAFLVEKAAWQAALGVWLFALAMQAAIAFLLAFFHRQELIQLATRPKTPSPTGPARAPAAAG